MRDFYNGEECQIKERLIKLILIEGNIDVLVWYYTHTINDDDLVRRNATYFTKMD